MSMNFNWNFAQPANGQAAFDAAQAALQNKRNNVYTQNMDNRTAGNANDMMAWMQQGNDAATYQQQQAAAAEQQAIAAEQQAQQEAAQKQAQIDSIKSRIKELESQIAANQSKLKNWSGIDGQIAALEARKINTQDPTSVWRWKQTQEQAMQTRREDMERVKEEKKLAETKNKQINRNKIDNILQSTIPSSGWKRDKLDLAAKQLNDAEELAKNYNDTDALKKIYDRKNELGIYVPVDDEANIVNSEFIREQSMIGKKGGKTKAEFAKYVTELTSDPKYRHIWTYYPELLQKFYAAIGKNTGAKPTNYVGY